MPSRIQCPEKRPSAEADKDEQENYHSGDEDSGSDSYEEADSPHQQKSKKHKRQVPTSKEPRLKKKKQRSRSSSSDEEDTPAKPRKPLKQSFHQNRQHQRLSNHPNSNMARGKSKRKQQQRNGDSDEETVDANTLLQQQQIADLQAENLRLKKRQKYASNFASKSTAKSAGMSAMSREVKKITKNELWSLKKFIYNDKKLYSVTKFVLKRLGDLVDLSGLSADDRVDAQEQWIATHAEDVRKAMNDHRNYVQSELRDTVKKIFNENREDQLPTVAQVLDIVMRKGFNGSRKAVMETKFDCYWDVLLPKVAGNNLWSPNKRYYQLLSYASTPSKVEGVDDVPCAHHSTEAIFATIWENSFPKWKCEFTQKRQGNDLDEGHKDMKTKGYVDNVCGRKKFGGWTDAGKERCHQLAMEIKQNRVDKETQIREIEQACLDRLREKHGRAAIDAKKKAPRAKKGGVIEEEPEDSDCEQWFED